MRATNLRKLLKKQKSNEIGKLFLKPKVLILEQMSGIG